MDIETAQGHVSAPPVSPAVHWQQLAARLAAHHEGAPQRAKLCEIALAEAQSAIGRLAALGHNFYLVEGSAPPPLEWPKMLYHATQEPRTVHYQSEAEELGPGWFDHPEKARSADALAVQFAGRGGVPRTGLPATLEATQTTDEEPQE